MDKPQRKLGGSNEQCREYEQERYSVWSPVVGYEGLYEASDNGLIRNALTKSIRSQYLKNNGYYEISLSKGSEQKTKVVHHLIAYAFLGPRPEGMFVCHIDGDETNNSLVNLRYGTREENMKDIQDHKSIKKIMEDTYESEWFSAHVKAFCELVGPPNREDVSRIKNSLKGW